MRHPIDRPRTPPGPARLRAYLRLERAAAPPKSLLALQRREADIRTGIRRVAKSTD
jgi:hypothetical protein